MKEKGKEECSIKQEGDGEKWWKKTKNLVTREMVGGEKVKNKRKWT